MSPAHGAPDGSAAPTPPENPLARAERLARIQELLVAGLIHDLRTPLMAINLSAEVALLRSHAEAVEQAARRIKTSGERMGRVFDHLLNLSRRAPDVGAPAWARSDLRALAEAVRAERSDGAADRPIELSASGDSVGVFDPEMLQRTLRRMLATLLEHAPPGAVNVEIEGQHPDRLWLRMSTAGVIDPEVQERLFVPREPRGGLELPGIGLDLAEVDPLVRAHGGSVLGRSRTGIGTVFELLLPRDASASGA